MYDLDCGITILNIGKSLVMECQSSNYIAHCVKVVFVLLIIREAIVTQGQYGWCCDSINQYISKLI